MSNTTLSCTGGPNATHPVNCNNGTLDLVEAAGCTLSPGDGSVSYIDYPISITCPNTTAGPVAFKLRARSSQYPPGDDCGPVEVTIYVQNTSPTTCSDPLAITGCSGTSSSSPLLCSAKGDPMDLRTASGCSLSGQGARWLTAGAIISCPPSGQTMAYYLYAEASPNYGDRDTCGPLNTTIYVRNDREFGTEGGVSMAWEF